MDTDRLAALALAFPIMAAAAAPGVAQACPGYYEPCQNYSFWSDLAALNAAKIPSDGVIVLQGTHQGDDAESLPTIDLTVTRDGQPIAGALEATSLHGVLVWRPAEPWEAGASHALSGVVSNPPESEGCAPLEVVVEATVNIDAAPGAALEPADFTGASKVALTPQISLQTLACCEGATPTEDYGGCFGPYVQFDPDECAPTAAYGTLVVQIEGQPATTGPAAAQVVYTLKVDGNFYASGLTPNFDVFGSAPVCAVLEATDLASGALSVGPERCFGAEVADMLGPQVLDPAAKLQCALEQCALEGGPWDPMKCVPLDTDPPTTSDSDDGASSGEGSSSDAGSDSAGAADGDKGCGCDAGPGGDAGLLALVGLVGLARRRRGER